MNLYRYDTYRQCTSTDESMERCLASKAVVYCSEFEVIKETPKGYWINTGFNQLLSPNKWVSKTSRKRFAHLSKDNAWESFIARKKRQVQILQAQLANAQECLTLKQPNETNSQTN